jgi:hypothetical protein
VDLAEDCYADELGLSQRCAAVGVRQRLQPADAGGAQGHQGPRRRGRREVRLGGRQQAPVNLPSKTLEMPILPRYFALRD